MCQEGPNYPLLYLNGIQIAVGKSEILVLLAESMKNLNVIIRGPSPKDIWQQILTHLLNDGQILVEYLSPNDIFAKTKPFPLILDDIPSISQEELSTFADESKTFILNGKIGEVQASPMYPWSFPPEISLKKSQFQDLQLLQLKPPRDGDPWENLHHQQQFEFINSAFESFLGVDGTRKFKIEKVDLLHNPTIENKFTQAYIDMANQLDSNPHKQNTNKLWKEAILNKVTNFTTLHFSLQLPY